MADPLTRIVDEVHDHYGLATTALPDYHTLLIKYMGHVKSLEGTAFRPERFDKDAGAFSDAEIDELERIDRIIGRSGENIHVR